MIERSSYSHISHNQDKLHAEYFFQPRANSHYLYIYVDVVNMFKLSHI